MNCFNTVNHFNDHIMKEKIISGLLFLAIGVHAQVSPNFKDKFNFSLIENKVVLINSLIKGEKATLFFDTGAASSAIDSSFAKKVGIVPNSQNDVEGAGGKKTYKEALNQSILINNTKIDSIDFVIDDFTRLKDSSFKINFDYIIGYSLLKKL